MYGINGWDYVSEEKREEMREKNRIASTDWKTILFATLGTALAKSGG